MSHGSIIEDLQLLLVVGYMDDTKDELKSISIVIDLLQHEDTWAIRFIEYFLH